MFQVIQGHQVYVVDLVEFPPPMPVGDGGNPALKPYAEALTAAIKTEQITGPGKYGIEIYYEPLSIGLAYNVYRIDE